MLSTIGKTSTLIRAIIELTKYYPDKKILACAPSDAAADVVCKRLAKYFTRAELFRLNWWQRLPAAVPIELIDYCCVQVLQLYYEVIATAAQQHK